MNTPGRHIEHPARRFLAGAIDTIVRYVLLHQPLDPAGIPLRAIGDREIAQPRISDIHGVEMRGINDDVTSVPKGASNRAKRGRADGKMGTRKTKNGSPKSWPLNPQLLPLELRGPYARLRSVGFELRMTGSGRILLPNPETLQWEEGGLSFPEQREFARRMRGVVGILRRGNSKSRSKARREWNKPAPWEKVSLDPAIERADWEDEYRDWEDKYRKWVEKVLANRYNDEYREWAESIQMDVHDEELGEGDDSDFAVEPEDLPSSIRNRLLQAGTKYTANQK